MSWLRYFCLRIRREPAASPAQESASRRATLPPSGTEMLGGGGGVASTEEVAATNKLTRNRRILGGGFGGYCPNAWPNKPGQRQWSRVCAGVEMREAGRGDHSLTLSESSSLQERSSTFSGCGMSCCNESRRPARGNFGTFGLTICTKPPFGAGKARCRERGGWWCRIPLQGCQSAAPLVLGLVR